MIMMLTFHYMQGKHPGGPWLSKDTVSEDSELKLAGNSIYIGMRQVSNSHNMPVMSL